MIKHLLHEVILVLIEKGQCLFRYEHGLRPLKEFRSLQINGGQIDFLRLVRFLTSLFGFLVYSSELQDLLVLQEGEDVGCDPNR